jgi:hypothetical protein
MKVKTVFVKLNYIKRKGVIFNCPILFVDVNNENNLKEKKTNNKMGKMKR